MRRAGFIAFCIAVAVGACTAFSGGDDSTTPAPDAGDRTGKLNGPCYGNASCDPGLTCAGNVCVPDADATASPDGGDGGLPGEGGTGDGGVACPFSKSPSATLACGTDIGACSEPRTTCCMGNTTSSCIDGGAYCTGAPNVAQLGCDSKAWCGNVSPGTICCLQTSKAPAALGLQPLACPKTLSIEQFGPSVCSSACGATDYVLCASNGECGVDRTCQRLDVTSTSQGTLHIGFCWPR